MSILTTIALWLITVIALIMSIFSIKRHFLYTRYIRVSKIPFIKTKSYISGSMHSIVTPYESIADRVDKYFNLKGDIYGLFVGPVPCILTKDLDLIHLVWVKECHKHINRAFLGATSEHKDVSLLEARDDDWRRTRRAIGSSMTPAKLKADNVDRDITECISNMMASLDRKSKTIGSTEDGIERKSVIIDCSSLFKTFTMDAFMTVGFDQTNLIDYDLDDNKIITNAKEYFRKAQSPIVLWTMYIPQLAPIVRNLIKIFKLNSFAHYLFSLVEKIITKMLNVKIDKFDKKLVHTLIGLYKDGKINLRELRYNIFFLLLAGWDTTADTLTGLMWELAKNPRIQDKLRKEIVKNGIESKYLECVIKETLRIHPPAITGREIGEDFEWKGYKLMKGMFLCLANYSIQRDKNIWGQDALKFRPERFEDSDNFHPAQFLAFGLGPRNCVGVHMAMLELKNVTSRLLMNYQIISTKDTPDRLTLKEGTGTVFFANLIQDPIPLEFVSLDPSTK